jgi:hypothetical protein
MDDNFRHQGQAVDAWCGAGHLGVLEMATGSGKHGRPVAVVISVEEYDRLLSLTKRSGQARTVRSASEKTNR